MTHGQNPRQISQDVQPMVARPELPNRNEADREAFARHRASVYAELPSEISLATGVVYDEVATDPDFETTDLAHPAEGTK